MERRETRSEVVLEMVLEVARPVALALCLLSLYAVFHAAFLTSPTEDLSQRAWDALEKISLAAGIAVAGGMLFREGERGARLMRTLPMRVFCWSAGLMVLMFVASWYFETQGIFWKDVRRW